MGALLPAPALRRAGWMLLACAVLLGAAALRPAPAAAAGYAAVVAADGECLRMRAGPGVTHPVMTCLPDGLAVQVLPGGEDGPDFRWVPVTGAGRTGWVAEQFLRPLAGGAPAQPSPAQPSAAQPSPAQPVAATTGTPPPAGALLPTAAEAAAALASDVVPPVGRTGLVVSGGGRTAALVAAAAQRGCAVAQLWANGPDGRFIGYLAGAPDFVNRPWLERFPATVPAGEALLMVCGPLPATPPVFREPDPQPQPQPLAAGAGERLTVDVTYYYCEQGSIPQAIGDGGGFCGSSYAGTPVAAGLAACAPDFFGQRFRIVGDPTAQIYRCDDLGSAVVPGHRDIWFANSDQAWAWWTAVGSTVVIEVLPEAAA